MKRSEFIKIAVIGAGGIGLGIQAARSTIQKITVRKVPKGLVTDYNPEYTMGSWVKKKPNGDVVFTIQGKPLLTAKQVTWTQSKK